MRIKFKKLIKILSINFVILCIIFVLTEIFFFLFFFIKSMPHIEAFKKENLKIDYRYTRPHVYNLRRYKNIILQQFWVLYIAVKGVPIRYDKKI